MDGPDQVGTTGDAQDIISVWWHAGADDDYAALPSRRDRASIDTVVAKLEALGARLPFPHSSDIRGPRGEGLRELRPTRERSPRRVVYAEISPSTFVILAIGPEAGVDKRRFKATLLRAQQRLAGVEQPPWTEDV